MVPWLIAAAAITGGMNALNRGNAEISQWEGRERGQRFNAAVRRQQASMNAEAFSAREDQQRRQGALAMGSAKTFLSQSGTGTGGSNADIAVQNQIFTELDALNVRYEGQLQRHNLNLEAMGEDMAADVSHTQANLASKGKLWGFLGSMANAGAMAYGYSK